MKIAIASGKGGVGKSMLASSLAILFAQSGKKIIAVDCDVDAPNLAIWLGGVSDWDTSKKITTLNKPKIDAQKCLGCGKCVQSCQFNALRIENNKVKLDSFLCEGCGVCQIVCPQKAITLNPVKNAQILIKNKTRYGFPLVSAQLFPGESGSGKVVSEVKKEAEKFKYDIMIIDAAPGTGCPVNAALFDVDFAVLITEPTPSGISDLSRILETVNYFKIPYQVVINKWDINPSFSKRVEKEFAKKILGKISYEQKTFQAISQLIPIIETNLKTKQEIEKIYSKLISIERRKNEGLCHQH